MPYYYEHLTSYENLEITRWVLKSNKVEIHRVLAIMGLSEVRNKKVKEFSLGMKVFSKVSEGTKIIIKL